MKKIILLITFCLVFQNCTKAEILAPFEENELWGYKNAQGKVVIAPQYILAKEFLPQGIAAVADKSGWVYINKQGEEVIRPFIFDNGPDYFSEGLARYTENGKIGFFNKKGEKVIKAQFDFASPFKDGKAEVCQGCTRQQEGEHYSMIGGKKGYINLEGKIVRP